LAVRAQNLDRQENGAVQGDGRDIRRGEEVRTHLLPIVQAIPDGTSAEKSGGGDQ
jgi:hypothetical protein